MNLNNPIAIAHRIAPFALLASAGCLRAERRLSGRRGRAMTSTTSSGTSGSRASSDGSGAAVGTSPGAGAETSNGSAAGASGGGSTSGATTGGTTTGGTTTGGDAGSLPGVWTKLQQQIAVLHGRLQRTLPPIARRILPVEKRLQQRQLRERPVCLRRPLYEWRRRPTRAVLVCGGQRLLQWHDLPSHDSTGGATRGLLLRNPRSRMRELLRLLQRQLRERGVHLHRPWGQLCSWNWLLRRPELHSGILPGRSWASVRRLQRLHQRLL